MYTHTITGRIFDNIFTHFNFLIYGISIKIIIFCNYTHTNLENYSCNSIHIYVIYVMQ